MAVVVEVETADYSDGPILYHALPNCSSTSSLMLDLQPLPNWGAMMDMAEYQRLTVVHVADDNVVADNVAVDDIAVAFADVAKLTIDSDDLDR